MRAPRGSVLSWTIATSLLPASFADAANAGAPAHGRAREPHVFVSCNAQVDAAFEWKGRAWTLQEAPEAMPAATREELAAWGPWCSQHGYRAWLSEDAHVLLWLRQDRRDAAALAELAARAQARVDSFAPQPVRSKDETFLSPSWGRGQHVPDRDPVSVALLDSESDLDTLLTALASKQGSVASLDIKKGTPAFTSCEAHAGALLSAPAGVEIGTVWRAENEIVNRLARLLLHRRFGALPYWIDMGFAWRVEGALQGNLYSFPGRDEFVSVHDHAGWKNELKNQFKKRKKEPLRLEEFADWKAGSWRPEKVALAWGFAEFLAKQEPAAFSAICEDLRLDVKQGSVRTAEDGSWTLVPDYQTPLEAQHAILARHLGDDYLERASEFFRTWK